MRDRLGAIIGLCIFGCLTVFIYIPLVVIAARAIKAYWS